MLDSLLHDLRLQLECVELIESAADVGGTVGGTISGAANKTVRHLVPSTLRRLDQLPERDHVLLQSMKICQ